MVDGAYRDALAEEHFWCAGYCPTENAPCHECINNGNLMHDIYAIVNLTEVTNAKP